MARCCKCGRALSEVRLTYQGKPIGPSCGAKVGLPSSKPSKSKAAKKRKPRRADHPEVERDTFTIDMFDALQDGAVR